MGLAADHRSHIVKQSPIFDQLALGAAKVMERLELRKELAAEPGHLLAVRPMPMAPAPQVQYRALPRVWRFAADFQFRSVPGEIVKEHAFAQCRATDLQVVDLQALHQKLHKKRGGEDLIAAL